MTILERLKDAEVEIKALLQDLEEERNKNADLQHDVQVRSEKVRYAEQQMHDARTREEQYRKTSDKLRIENSALRRDLIVSRTETKNLQELYEEQVRYTASMCKRLQSGKDWFVVKRLGNLSALAFDNKDASTRCNEWNKDVTSAPIHVREVVNVDYYPEPKPGKVEDVKHFNRTLTPEEVKAEYEQSSYGIRSVTQWPVSPEPLWTPLTDLADGWFHIDAIQIIDYDWRYAGWTDGTRRYGPICCTGPLSTLDTVSLLDEWGNDLLTWEGMQKHCSDISKRLEETNNNRNEAWARYGDVCRTNVTLETRLEHAMKLLRDISEIFKKGWHPSIELQVRVKELIAKYKESPLDVPNPQGEQLKKAMELLAELDRSWRRGYVESVQFDKVKALVEKYGEGGDDE